MSSRQVVVGLGSNLGDRAGYLAGALARLEAHPEIRVEARSSVVETPALTQPQPDFLNAAVRLRTTLPPEALLDVLLGIEHALGRERRERWGARTIDLDVLWIAGETVQTDRLTVPHPGLTERSFALFPLLEVLAPADPGGPPLRARAALLSVPRRVGALVSAPAIRDP
jgi:2-amino-4-hydroxy-6-hydroxymethyldihydropteridine diphosphokinase